MHITVRNPDTGEYVELCIPQFSKMAYIVRASTTCETALPEAQVIARAMGAELLADVSNPVDFTASQPPQIAYWRLT